jgi:prepilin peptidase CpaA
MNAQVWIAILVGLAAVIDDLRRRMISDWICVAAAVGGLGWQIAQNGWMGTLYALGGAATGAGVFLIFFLLGGMGGGDIKLMTGFGALLGAGRLLEAALWTAGIGGLFAVLVLGFRSLRGKFGKQPAPVGELTEEQKLHRESIPYAPAIALGVWLSLVPKG